MYRIELLENGLLRVCDSGSKLVGLYEGDTGLHRAGFEFVLTAEEVLQAIQQHQVPDPPLEVPA